MSSLFQNKANVITAILIGVVLVGGGFFLIRSRQSADRPSSFISPDTQSAPIAFGVVTPISNAPASNTLISVLSGLRTISLDGSLFKDPVFLSLQDFGIPLQEEQVGRYNPFLPIGNDASAVSSISQPDVSKNSSPASAAPTSTNR
ncbi:MAG: hypothetical protein AAB447_00165 [Patescibacteria group bacterium]